MIGSPDANIPQDIQLVGSHIISEHCVFENTEYEVRQHLPASSPLPLQVKLLPCPGALCYVNGRSISEPVTLRTGSRVILGKNHVFR